MLEADGNGRVDAASSVMAAAPANEMPDATTTAPSASPGPTSGTATPSKKSTRTSVIVIGAGMSGLACACELKHRGYHVLVVEARRRAGGRLNGASIRTRRQPGMNDPDEQYAGTYTDIDLGGALIHGMEDNPVASLVEEMGHTVRPVSECLLLSQSGWPIDPREDERISSLFNECLDIAFARISEQIDGNDNENPKGSFGELFRAVCAERNVSPSGLLQWHQANLEVSCGASFDRLGFKWNEDEQYGFEGDHVAMQQSWKAVTETLAQGLDILYDAPIKEIQIVHPPSMNRTSSRSLPRTVRPAVDKPKVQYNTIQSTSPSARLSHRLRGVAAGARRSIRSRVSTDRFTIDRPKDLSQPAMSSAKKATPSAPITKESMVRVTLHNDAVLQAHAVVCTLPLGILKAKAVAFDPPLPLPKQHAIQRLGVGLLNKCVLSFSHVFWQDSDFLGLAANDRAYLVLNGHKYTGKPILIFMYGGDFARDIQDWTDQEIVEDCLQRLRVMCGSKLAPVLDYRVTRWGKEQYSLMSFSYVPPGVDGPLEYQAMSEPLLNHDGTAPVLMFAGEHTTPYHPSTIHGAFLSGIREAYRLDCALFPEANDNLEFRDDELYQRTFSIESGASDVTGGPGLGTRNASVGFLHGKPKVSRQHRRRGAATVVNAVDRNVSSDDNILAAASRRSQRGALVANGTTNDAMGSEFEMEQSIAILEDEQIGRGIERYGRDYGYIQSTILPVHGSDSRWTLSKIRSRVQSVMGSARKRKPSTSSWKRWLVRDGNKEGGPTPKPSKSRPKSTSAVSKSSVAAVPVPKKPQLLTVTRSGRKVRTLVATTKRSNVTKTRSGRSIKKPRTL